MKYVIILILFCSCQSIKVLHENDSIKLEVSDKNYQIVFEKIGEIEIKDSMDLARFLNPNNSESEYLIRYERYKNDFKYIGGWFRVGILDKKNKWEKRFYISHGELELQAFDDKFVVVDCFHGTLAWNFKIIKVGKRPPVHDIRIINRKTGNIIKRIQIDKGFSPFVVYDNTLFVKYVKFTKGLNKNQDEIMYWKLEDKED